MPEYIERERYLRLSDIKAALMEYHGEQVMSKYLTVAECKAARFGIEGALYAIEDIPAADVALVVHGRWKYCGSFLCECQNCGEIYSLIGNGGNGWNYCPNCGARMDGE